MSYKPHIPFLAVLLLAAVGSLAQVRQPFTVLRNNADTANKKLYVEVMYEKPGCGDYMAMFTLVDRVGVTRELEIDSVLNNTGTYQLSADRRALMRPTAGGYRLRFDLLPNASVNDGYRMVVNTYKMAYRCAGCGAAGSDAIFEPKHVKAGCPPLEGEVLACHRRTGRMANWEAWIQDPRDCNPYRVVMLPDGKWWFSQNLRWSNLGQYATDGSRLYRWYEAVMGREVPTDVQLLLTLNSNEVGPQGVCPTGWHVPTEWEWHNLGVSMGSGAATPTDKWQPRALHHLISFNYYGTTGLREGSDESGFTWMPTPFIGVRGINSSSVKHGALWSAGATSNAADELAISRIAAQATTTAWATNPLMADNRAGNRALDMLPLRCAYGAGVLPTVEGMVPLLYYPDIAAPDSVCWMENFAVSVEPADLHNGYTYTWSVNPGGGKLTFAGSGTPDAYRCMAVGTGLTTADTGRYTLTCTVRSIATGATVSGSKEIVITPYAPEIIAPAVVEVQHVPTFTATRPDSEGYTYTWTTTGKATFPGSGTASAYTMRPNLSSLSTADAAATYTVTVKNTASGRMVSATTASIPVCPYGASDLLAATCGKRTTGNRSWTVQVADARDNSTYRAVQLPNGKWWFAQNLRWSDLGQYATDGSRLYRWYEAVSGREVSADRQLLLTLNSDSVGPQGVCPTGWHLPTVQEWHGLGRSVGSGAATPTDGWGAGSLARLAGGSWGAGLGGSSDSSGFGWTPTPFEGVYGIGGGAIRYGAFWSAGSRSEPHEQITMSRVAAQVAEGVWAGSPLTVDSRMGHKAKDLLPVRCIQGAGVPPTVSGLAPLPYEDTPPCAGCLCGLMESAGLLRGAGCAGGILHPGALTACPGGITDPGTIGCFN